MSDTNAALVIAFDARIGQLEGALARVNRTLKSVDNEAKRTRASVTQSLGSLGNDVSVAFARAATAIVAFGTAWAGLAVTQGIRGVINSVGELADTANQLDVSTASLIAFRDAFAEGGGNAEAANQSLQRIGVLIGDASRGSEEAINTFAALGVAFKNTDGSIRTTENVLQSIIARINETESQTEKLSLAAEVVGRRAAPAFVAAIGEMDGSLPGYIQRMRELGIVVGDDTPAKFDTLNTSLDRLKQTFVAAFAEAIASVAPALTRFFTQLQTDVTAAIAGLRGLMQRNRELSDPTLQGLQNQNAQALVRLRETERRARELESERPSTTIIGGLFARNAEAIDRDLMANREANRLATERVATLQREIEGRTRLVNELARINLPADVDPTRGNAPITPEDRPGRPPTPITRGGGTSEADRELNRRLAEASRLLEGIADKARPSLEALQAGFNDSATAVAVLTANMGRLSDVQRQTLENINFGTISGQVTTAAEQTAAAMLRAGASAKDIERQIEESVRAYAQRLVDLNRLTAEQVEQLVARTTAATQRVTQARTTFSQGLGEGIGIDPKNQTTFEFDVGRGVAQTGLQFFDNLTQTLDKVAEGSVTAGEAMLKLAADFAKSVALMVAKLALLRAVQAAFNYFFPATPGVPTPGAASFGGARMAGGAVAGGYSYLVGERGPELFTPRGSGTITNNRGLYGGVPTLTIQNNAPGVVIEPQQIDSRTVIAAVNQARTEIARDYSTSMRTGYGPYSEHLMRTHQLRRRL
jgi:hypothetical protein